MKVAARPVRRRWLPKQLQTVLESAIPGELLGPIAMGQQWIVLKVESINNPELDASVETFLGDAIFKRWMHEKISTYKIRLDRDESSEVKI